MLSANLMADALSSEDDYLEILAAVAQVDTRIGSSPAKEIQAKIQTFLRTNEAHKIMEHIVLMLSASEAEAE